MARNYLFYDIETTGLNKAFDQVLQFAAIRTDAELKEIERYFITVKLRPDIIPSPMALLTNRISITELSTGICEFEALQQIHQRMNQPDTISLGYNTLGFDDEFLRFAFYRNLLKPYTHQFKNGCRRMDLLPMTIIYWLFKRDILNWPEISGKPSLKLEHLGAANRLLKGQSHDAIVDVSATVELARRFFSERKMWDYLEGYFEKDTDNLRVAELPISFQSAAGGHQMGLMVNSEYGPQQNYLAPVLSIGTSIPYPNQTLWLRLDLSSLQETTGDSFADTTWIVRKRFGEPGILLPPIERYWKRLGEDRKVTVAQNLGWLQSETELFQEIIRYHREYSYPFIPNLDADAALYQIGFFSRDDEKAFGKFHKASLKRKAEMIGHFKSAEADILAARVLARNFPGTLPPEYEADFQAYMSRVNASDADDALIDYKGDPRMTPACALAEIERLRQNRSLDHAQIRLLEELKEYVEVNFHPKQGAEQLTIDF
jgi:exodeoxyribonuclease-1